MNNESRESESIVVILGAGWRQMRIAGGGRYGVVCLTVVMAMALAAAVVVALAR